MELGAKPTLSSNVWGWGSGYVIVAIEIKLQKQHSATVWATFQAPLPCLSHVYVCLCAHREQFVDTGFLQPQVSEE